MTTKDSWARKVEVTEPKATRSKPDGPTKSQGATQSLTDQQRLRVEKGSAAITKDRAALDEVMKVFSGNAADYLPAPTKHKVDIVTKLAEVALADLAVAAAPDWESAFADLMGNMHDAKTQLQTATRSVKVYAEQAKTEMAQLDP